MLYVRPWNMRDELYRGKKCANHNLLATLHLECVRCPICLYAKNSLKNERALER